MTSMTHEERMVSLTRAIREHSSMELASIREAGQYGADSGWPGFSYTSDGADFYRANATEIWELAADIADQLGAPNVPALVGGFARSDMAATTEGFECLLAWFALEECGRFWSDREENRAA